MKLGPYDPVDETTTNIYVGNINPKVCVLLYQWFDQAEYQCCS